MQATLDGNCTEDYYRPSELEEHFDTHALEWTEDPASLCEHLPTKARRTWIQENLEGSFQSGASIFSVLCKKGEAPQLLEPLAGILRDPRMICDGVGQKLLNNIDWLVLADKGKVQASPQGSEAPDSFMKRLGHMVSSFFARRKRTIFFDAGGTRFMDAMNFFTSQYEKRGIQFSEIYVWEAVPQGREAYWEGTPPEVRSKWQPRLTFYDGIPISADPTSWHNPLRRIVASCEPEDFCAFKLDIDTPSVEGSIVQELIESPAVVKVLDEFFFEQHVSGLMQLFGWGPDVDGTFADSYKIFTQLRKMGLRAHSWV